MASEIKYDSGFYKIEVDTIRGLVSSRWLRSVNEAEMRAGGEKLCEVLMETKLEKVVANAQLLGALDADTKEWMSTTFYNKLSHTPLKKIARVLPDNLFHQLGLESVVTRAQALSHLDFIAKTFTNQQDAVAWLFEE